MEIKRKYITEFIGLDLLRFALSVTVLIRNYYHFYGPFPDGPFVDVGGIITEQPLYNILGFVYNQGGYAVQVFWLVSGLIFYSVYHEDIVNKKINFAGFSFLRFSRLYPLHFATLLVVALLQLYFFQQYGTYFTYQENDLSHFFLQLFFMGTWFPTIHHSFNVPVWSVSVEIFVYIIFYLITAASITKGKGLTLIILVLFVFNIYGMLPPFNECLLYFFSGCLLAKLVQSGIPLKSLLVRYVLVTIICIVTVIVLRRFLPEDLLIMDDDLLFMFRVIPISSSLVLTFILIFHNITSQRIISVFRGLGNMTYSLYLVHFPMQVLIFLIVRPTSHTFFNSPYTLISFMAICILVAWIVYEYFEKPAQKYLRIKYSQRISNKESIIEQGQQFERLKAKS